MNTEELALRIVLIQPPAGVVFALQRGKGSAPELASQTLSRGKDLSFNLTVRFATEPGGLNFLGPFVQGPRGGRFVYVNSGMLAGQTDTCWTRRAKIHLAGLTRSLVNRATQPPGSVLEVRVPGTARDGGPVCASVPLGEGWKMVSSRNRKAVRRRKSSTRRNHG